MAITRFDGQYQFLSNFYPVVIEFEGIRYASVEHAFQAAKTLSVAQRQTVARASTPGAAKRMGRKVTLRPNWNGIKRQIMEGLVRQKFSHPHLRSLLLQTGSEELVEGNSWHDTYWGQCPVGQGSNWLGKILMKVRAELLKMEPLEE